MKPIKLTAGKKSFNLDFDKHFAHLAKINQSLNFGATAQYQKIGLTYVDVPEIVGITGACENVDTLFKVYNNLAIPLFFTQTGQLALEQALQSFPGCYTVIHSGRDEEEEDERHLRQFRLTEEEFDSSFIGQTRSNYDEEKMFRALLTHIQSAVQAMIRRVLEDHGGVLRQTYKRDVARLREATRRDFYRISYEEAVSLLNKNGFPRVRFGDDLKADHEAKIVKLLNRGKSEIPVFITKYPKEIKFFNMMVSQKDPRVVLSADLIFPYSGEGTGSAVREHDFAKLNERLLTSTMYKLHVARGGRYEDFGWYLAIIKGKGTQPHAGYGIGNERVLQYIFAQKDIRNVSLFSLLNRQTGDWDKGRYGQAALYEGDKKHILLTIGRAPDKKALLGSVRLLAKKPKFVLYATEHTHRYLKEHGVRTSFVHKISQIGKKPNIAEFLKRREFDLIINIPTRDKVATESREFTDGKLMRRSAVELGIALVTDVEVAQALIVNLTK
jgi:asparaginyl-tRNA synthetase